MRVRIRADVFNSFPFLIFVALLGASACSLIRPGTLLKQNEKYLKIQREAEACFQEGEYASLERAAELFGALADVPGYREASREKLLRTYMILALRTKELGILDGSHLRKAQDLFEENPQRESAGAYLSLVHVVRASISGILGESPDVDERSLEKSYDWAREHAGELNASLKQRALHDDFFAYLYLALHKDFVYWIKEKTDLLPPAEIRSASPLLQYKLSLVPTVDPESLSGLLRARPEFAEARLHLGMALLAQGNIVRAEEHFSRAIRSFPQSLSCLMGLARVSFFFEEFTKCLNFYELMLQIVPSYREALLGKAICLTYLDRHEDALETCRKIQELGKYYMGESHFWSAQNYYDRGLNEPALESIEEAEKYIFGNYEVLLLGGKIRYALGKIEDADKDFRNVLKIIGNDNEAAFHLGKISAEKNLWLESGEFFALAAEGGRMVVTSLEGKIKEITDSDVSEERRARMLLKRESEVIRARLKLATSFYNAAAGFFNAGAKDKALECATRALEHPSFKDLAEALIKKIG